jgi:hypothetical protein
MRFFFLLMIFAPSLLRSQVSNVRQTVDNGRIIITYDLRGSEDTVYNIGMSAATENGETVTPRAIAGDLAAVSPGEGRSIWWEPTLDGLALTGWKVTLTAKEGIGIKWIYVKGGPTGDFYISATEVTFAQYDMFCEATGYKKPDDSFGRGKQPVINVNVADAVAYCNWLSKETGTTVRLPEENEWEYAAKGGNRSKGYEYSGSNTIDEVAWYDTNSGNKSHEVATKRANELGIYDMSGNVWEWCGTSGAIRGGSWIYIFASRCRVSYSCDLNPINRDFDHGFRVLQKR